MTAKNGSNPMGRLSAIDDPRGPSNVTLYDFREILISIATALSDSDQVENIAFAPALKLVFGQEKVADNSNEINTIQELLETFYLKGCLACIDVMGCQKAIARAIIGWRGDCMLAVKGDQWQPGAVWGDDQRMRLYSRHEAAALQN